MYERKYQSYKISVTYLNGDTETIEYNEKDSRNYKQMLELYSQTKETFLQERTCCQIKFCGVTEDNNINIIFHKDIIIDEEIQIKERATEAIEKSSCEIAEEIVSLLGLLKEKHNILSQKSSVLEKKQSTLLHIIEDAEDFSDEEKLKTIDNLINIRKERRNIKNEITVINSVKSQDKMTLDKLESYISKIIKSSNTVNKNSEKIKKQGVENFVFIKEIPYRNFQELTKLRNEMKEKYDRVHYDNSEMKLYCYNKCGGY